MHYAVSITSPVTVASAEISFSKLKLIKKKKKKKKKTICNLQREMTDWVNMSGTICKGPMFGSNRTV